MPQPSSQSRPRRRPVPPPTLVALAALALASLAALLSAAPAAAQDVRLSGLGGERLDDAELARGATVVVVWACWSPRSHDIVDRVKLLTGHWAGKARVVMLDFQEDRQTVEAFLAGKPPGVPVFLDTDGAFSKKFAVATLPGLVVVKDGKPTYHGKLPDDADRVIAEAIR